jgi:hypothetical protein
VTPSVSSKRSPDASDNQQGLASISESRCTSGCTTEPKSEQADPVAALAAALLGLSPEDRVRLAAMLGKADNG